MELAGIAYVGSGVLGSAIGMDKDVAKRLLRDAGIPVVDFAVVTAGAFRRDPAAALRSLPDFGYPRYVKPANAGSSVGVSRVAGPGDLERAVRDALAFDTKVLVERGVDAREIECAVLGNDDPQASVPGEIVVHHKDGFYSYDAKYVDPEGASWKIPAELPPEMTARVRTQAVATFRALELAGMARVDFFVTRDYRRDLRQRGEHHPGVHRRVDVPEDVGGVGASPERTHHAPDRARDRAPRRAPRAEDDAVARSLRTCRLEKRSVRYARPAQKFPCIQIASRSYIARGQRQRETRRGPPFQGAALQGVRRRPPAEGAKPAVARDRGARARRGLRRRQERALFADRERAAASHAPAQRSRSRPRRDRASRLRASRRALPRGRRAHADVLRVAARVLALRRRVARPRPDRRDVRAHAGGAPRGDGRRAVAGGVRSAAPDRRARRRRRPGDRVGSRVRLCRARDGRRRRGARAARRRTRSRHEPRELVEARVLQDRELRR